MNQTPLDLLFSTTAAPADRPGLGRRTESPFGFNDHLNSATESRGQRDSRDDRSRQFASAAPPSSSLNHDDTSSRSRLSEPAKTNSLASDDSDDSDRDDMTAAATDATQPPAGTAPAAGSNDQPESETAVEAVDAEGKKLTDGEAATASADEEAESGTQEIAAELATSQRNSTNTAQDGATAEAANTASADSETSAAEVKAAASSKHEANSTAGFQEQLAAAEAATEQVGANGEETNAAATVQQAQPKGRNQTSANAKSTNAAANRDAVATGEELSAEAAVADEGKSMQPAKDSNSTADAAKDKDSSPTEGRRSIAAQQAVRSEAMLAATTIAAQAKSVTLADASAVAANGETAEAAPADAVKPGSAKQEGLASILDPSRSASAGKRSGQASQSEDMPRVDPARFVSRVAKAFHTAVERGGTLQLRLAPPELGAVRVELTLADGVMNAQLETENATAKHVLLEHLPALRERLAEQNIRIERFDVDVRDEGRNGQPQDRMRDDQQQQQEQHRTHSRRHPAARPQTTQAVGMESIPAPRIGSSRINLVV